MEQGCNCGLPHNAQFCVPVGASGGGSNTLPKLEGIHAYTGLQPRQFKDRVEKIFRTIRQNVRKAKKPDSPAIKWKITTLSRASSFGLPNPSCLLKEGSMCIYCANALMTPNSKNCSGMGPCHLLEIEINGEVYTTIINLPSDFSNSLLKEMRGSGVRKFKNVSVLLTHAHADACFGSDFLRNFNGFENKDIEKDGKKVRVFKVTKKPTLYANKITVDALEAMMPHILAPPKYIDGEENTVATIVPIVEQRIYDYLDIINTGGAVEAVVFPMNHGPNTFSDGYYYSLLKLLVLTDFKEIDPDIIEELSKCDIKLLIADCLNFADGILTHAGFKYLLKFLRQLGNSNIQVIATGFGCQFGNFGSTYEDHQAHANTLVEAFNLEHSWNVKITIDYDGNHFSSVCDEVASVGGIEPEEEL